MSAWFTPFRPSSNWKWQNYSICILIGILLYFNKLKLLRYHNFKLLSLIHHRLVMYFLWLIPLYVVFIVVSRLFFDSMIQIYRERIIFPIFLAIFLLIFYGISRLLHWFPFKTIYPERSYRSSPIRFCWVSFFQGYRTRNRKFLARQNEMELVLPGSGKTLQHSLITTEASHQQISS